MYIVLMNLPNLAFIPFREIYLTSHIDIKVISVNMNSFSHETNKVL